MDILIFGASGGTGHELVKQALQNENRVIAFLRNPSKFRTTHPDLKVIQGNVKDYAAVQEAVQPHIAVLIALGASSPFKRDMDLIQGMRNIVKAMKLKDAQRIIYLSFAGVKDSQNQLGYIFRHTAVPLLRKAVKDHEAKETIIKESSLQWTIVRPVVLTNGPHTGNFVSGEYLKPKLSKLMISRADVADFMLNQLTENSFLSKSVLLAKK